MKVVNLSSFFNFEEITHLPYANNVDFDQTPRDAARDAASDLGQHCLQMSFL